VKQVLSRFQPLTAWTKRNYLAAVKQFFQQGAEWQWEDVPDHPLLLDSDQPKMPLNVPRYIPDDELVPLMEAIGKLDEDWDANTGLRSPCPNIHPNFLWVNIRPNFQSLTYFWQ